MKTPAIFIALGFVVLTACHTASTAAAPPETLAEAASRLAPVRPAPNPVEVPPGALLAVRIISTLSTKTNKPGETFTAELAQPLSVNGAVIAPKGTPVTGVVASASPGGRLKGRAKLALRLTSIQSPTGPLAIATSLVYQQANGTRKRDAIAIGAASVAGAGIGALAGGGSGAATGTGIGAGAGAAGVLLTGPAPAVIPAESVLTFTLQGRVKVNRS